MPRLMSVSHTKEAVRSRQKTVTRRLGWWEDKNGRRLLHPGDRLTLCEQVMGRKKGEPLVRLAEVEVVDVSRGPLWHLEIYDVYADGNNPQRDVAAEGFPDWTPADFIDFFCRTFKVDRHTEVTRVQWRYLDAEVSP